MLLPFFEIHQIKNKKNLKETFYFLFMEKIYWKKRRSNIKQSHCEKQIFFPFLFETKIKFIHFLFLIEHSNYIGTAKNLVDDLFFIFIFFIQKTIIFSFLNKGPFLFTIESTKKKKNNVKKYRCIFRTQYVKKFFFLIFFNFFFLIFF